MLHDYNIIRTTECINVVCMYCVSLKSHLLQKYVLGITNYTNDFTSGIIRPTGYGCGVAKLS